MSKHFDIESVLFQKTQFECMRMLSKCQILRRTFSGNSDIILCGAYAMTADTPFAVKSGKRGVFVYITKIHT